MRAISLANRNSDSVNQNAQLTELLGLRELLQVVAVEVEVGVDLVQRGQHDSEGVVAVDHGHVEGVGKLALVVVVASPGSGLRKKTKD